MKIKYYSHEIFDVAKWGIHDFYDNIMIDFAITMKPSVSRVIDWDYYIQGVSRLEIRTRRFSKLSSFFFDDQYYCLQIGLSENVCNWYDMFLYV